jgi:anti-sigma regulatory factor (Ser/Thr protein kinase)
MKKKVSKFKINFPASGKYISPSRLAISSLASQADFSVEEIQEIKHIFSNACRCAIEQSFGGKDRKESRSLMVECAVDDNKMNIGIAGKGFRIDLQKEKQK